MRPFFGHPPADPSPRRRLVHHVRRVTPRNEAMHEGRQEIVAPASAPQGDDEYLHAIEAAPAYKHASSMQPRST